MSGNYKKAEKYALELQNAGLKDKNSETIGMSKYLLGTIYNNLSKYDLALKKYAEAYSYLQNNQLFVAALYLSIGNVYRHLNNFKSALNYINAAKDIAKKSTNENLMASALFYTSVIYLNQKKYNKAYVKIIECNKLSSNSDINNFDQNAINIIQGRILYCQKKYNKATALFTNILNESNDSNYFSFIATLYLGKIYTQQKKGKRALEFLDRAKMYNNKMGNIEIHSRDLSYAFAELYYADKNYKLAYEYHTKYNKIKSKILNSIILSNASLLTSKYEDIQISMLNQKLMIKNQKINYTNNLNLLLIIIVTLIFTLLILFTLLYLNKKRFATKLNELNCDLDKLVKLKTEKLIQTVYKLQKEIRERKELQVLIREVSEREQQKIAHDIHDNLGQILVGVSFQAKALSNRIEKLKNEDLSKASNELINNISLASSQIRELSRILSNIELKNDGLILSLKKFRAYVLKQFDIKCNLTVNQKYVSSFESLNLQAKTNLYRIIQESVNNSIKHGKSKNISINLSHGKVTIKDEGIGYNTDIETKGIGLKIMKCRAEYLKGKLILHSDRNKGTTTICSFPMKKNSK
ncbi:MAG: hypothetical protein GY756_15195 [bacterium]|nr:hypothetical protein [bacterium]